MSVPQAGIIEEMLEDTFESMEDDDEMEEAAEAEVDKILFEITAGKDSLSGNETGLKKLFGAVNVHLSGGG